MKARDLIEKLSSMPPDAQVEIKTADRCLGVAKVKEMRIGTAVVKAGGVIEIDDAVRDNSSAVVWLVAEGWHRVS
ncbi:hypothetical protein ACFQ4M_15780 [Thauera mechernichensis]|uniref:Uncharacterized protein n=1 Tax=Thauera mechernichensis TaxID=82788 RepID=A0ABW3WGR0_9RHOO|nr:MULTISPECIES: hypothetical protein [Thauera]ENO91986.1 hypothetical protein C662_14286 [Thauera sp. 28]MDG3063286.1 hypothetical protein [Thauera mechernichensis]